MVAPQRLGNPNLLHEVLVGRRAARSIQKLGAGPSDVPTRTLLINVLRQESGHCLIEQSMHPQLQF